MPRIPLTQNKFALVDDEDFEFLNQWKWCAVANRMTFYVIHAEAGNNKQAVWMHREIMNPPKGMVVDHLDGNGLNNQKANLRICTNAENRRNRGPNSRNTTGYKGVSWHKIHGKFQANICINRKQIYLGVFTKPEDAARAYDNAAVKYHGEFARLNFPESTLETLEN